ncbi:MAG: DUF4040 domain-containing protein [Firmicutes bacterium]|nr:DUF4040 domain-containing protein [Bacillota bacterium]
MIYAILSAWIIIALLIVWEQRIARTIIYLAVFSLISSVVYIFLGSPDVAMAEAAASVFTTVFFIICFEKYFSRVDRGEKVPKQSIIKVLIPIIFTVFLFGLFIFVIPENTGQPHEINLSELYISSFENDFGGENAVTAIYLGYRVYDTLFEALVLVISVVAVIHMSHSKKTVVKSGKHSEMERDGMAVFAIRVICPVMLLFGVYLILNGHISPGGGFQGGLAIAAFFICRYMIYDVYDLPIRKLIRLEELVFAGIIIFAVIIVFWGFTSHLPPRIQPFVQTAHMIAMNALIGLKVACGFIILFYRYIAVESK